MQIKLVVVVVVVVVGAGARTEKEIAGFQLIGFALRDYNLRILDLFVEGVLIG